MLRKTIVWGSVFVMIGVLLVGSVQMKNEALASNLTGNVMVAGSEMDEVTPAIGSDSNGNIIVAYTVEKSIFDTDVLVSASGDSGATWKSIATPWGEMEGRQTNPEISYDPNVNKVIGTFADEAYPALMVFIADDVTDETTYEYNGWGGPDEIKDAGISYTTTNDGTELIVTMGVGAVSPFANTCVWGYMTFDPFEYFGGSYYYDAQSHIGEYTDTDYIKGFTFSGNIYGFIFDPVVGATGNKGIGIKWTTYDDEPDLEYVEHQFWLEDGGGDYNVRSPDVSASGSSIYVVYATDENIYGNYGIYMKYSNDGGATWTKVTVADDPTTDDLYPAVYAAGNTVYVVYTKNNNLYLTKSTDGGQTWEEPVQVNDQDGSVSMEEHTASISSRGIVWVDTRNGNRDIYFAPLPAPIITISITGGFGVNIEICNTGTVAAENLDWSVDLSGLVFMGGHAEGTIPTLEPGNCETVSSGLVFGIGPTTITVNAGGVTATASGFILGPLVIGV